MSWSHTVLFEGTEAETLNETVTYFPADGSVDSYTFSFSPAQPSVVLTNNSASGVSFTNDGSNLQGLFLNAIITYLENFVEVEVATWPEVPTGKRMVGFIADPSTEVTYTISITCYYTTAPVPPATTGTAATASTTLDLIVYQSYDSNQAILKQTVLEEQI